MTIDYKKSLSNITKLLALLLIIVSLTLISTNNKEKNVFTSSQELSNKKIGWGIKRNDNHEQPDLGKTNKEILERNNGIAMGNNNEKNIYLTFDEGYEAGYTSQILKTLKENDVKATFFITAHYLNTQPELVKQMIDDGHIVGNHIPVNSMYHQEKSYESYINSRFAKIKENKLNYQFVYFFVSQLFYVPLLYFYVDKKFSITC